MDRFETFRRDWEASEELLINRKRLMEGNRREVCIIIEELEERLREVEARRAAEVQSLELLLEATTEKLRISNRRLRASDEALIGLQSEADRRTLALEGDLEHTRREMSLLQDSMKALVHAHRKAKTDVQTSVETHNAHKHRERALEVREVHLVDQLSDAKGVIHGLRDELEAARNKSSELERAYLQSQRDLSVTQQQLDDHRANKDGLRATTQLKEHVRLLQDSLRRLLHVIAQFGANRSYDDAEMRRAKDLFRYVAATASHQFYFLGDSVVAPTPVEGRDAMLLQDLKTVVRDFSAQEPPKGNRGNMSSRIDPFLRLQTEKEFWLPKQVLDVAGAFHDKYFHEVPIDVVYTLVVSVATALKDYSSNILTPGEVALLAVEREEQAQARATAAAAAVRKEANRLRHSSDPRDGEMPRSSKQRHGSKLPAGRPPNTQTQSGSHNAEQLPDVARGITGLRCLISQIDTLCTSSGVFRTLPSSQVRDILSSCLRTMERMVNVCGRAAAVDDKAPIVLSLQNLEWSLDTSVRTMLDKCTEVCDATAGAYKALRSALKAPQDPGDPEIAQRRDCCASRGLTVVTKQFRCNVLSTFSQDQRRIVESATAVQQLLLGVRQVLYDFKLDELKRLSNA